MKTEYKENDITNKTQFEERMIQAMRGLTKGTILKTIDKIQASNDVETFNFGIDYAHSFACIADGDGTVYVKLIKADETEHAFRVLQTDGGFDETFGDIKSITIAATCPYRAIIRR